MKIKSEFSNLVIAGNWNNAIFNPEWVNKYLLTGETLRVEIPLYLNGSTRISTEELRIFTLDNKLHLVVLKTDDDIFRKIQEIANKVAEYLPHTPVNAFGINYLLESEENDKLNKYFIMVDSDILEKKGLKLKSTTIKRAFEKDNYVLNLSLSKNNGLCVFEFNYHYNIKSLVEFKEKMEEDMLVEFKNKSIDLVKDLFEVEYEG